MLLIALILIPHFLTPSQESRSWWNSSHYRREWPNCLSVCKRKKDGECHLVIGLKSEKKSRKFKIIISTFCRSYRNKFKYHLVFGKSHQLNLFTVCTILTSTLFQFMSVRARILLVYIILINKFIFVFHVLINFWERSTFDLFTFITFRGTDFNFFVFVFTKIADNFRKFH